MNNEFIFITLDRAKELKEKGIEFYLYEECSNTKKIGTACSIEELEEHFKKDGRFAVTEDTVVYIRISVNRDGNEIANKVFEMPCTESQKDLLLQVCKENKISGNIYFEIFKENINAKYIDHDEYDAYVSNDFTEAKPEEDVMQDTESALLKLLNNNHISKEVYDICMDSIVVKESIFLNAWENANYSFCIEEKLWFDAIKSELSEDTTNSAYGYDKIELLSLTDEEADVICMVADDTKMDCWFNLQKEHGVYTVYDLEGSKDIGLLAGLDQLDEIISCYDNVFILQKDIDTYEAVMERLVRPYRRKYRTNVKCPHCHNMLKLSDNPEHEFFCDSSKHYVAASEVTHDGDFQIEFVSTLEEYDQKIQLLEDVNFQTKLRNTKLAFGGKKVGQIIFTFENILPLNEIRFWVD